MSSHEFVINASLRTDVGKGASRRLRHEGKVPAVLYGGGRDPVSLLLDHNYMYHALEEEAFHSSILTLNLEDGRSQKVVLRDVQMHPVKLQVMHADFMRISDDVAIRLTVPLHFINEASSPAGKKGGVVISHQITEIEIEALPKNLPEFIEVDLGAIDAGEAVMLSSVKLPDGVIIPSLVHGGEDHDAPVASASYVGSGESASSEEEGESGEDEDQD
ncbi:MAG: 50S ribosomal protein L25/general stress protein Ctc [Wenzhouxiangellaceae bacterium]